MDVCIICKKPIGNTKPVKLQEKGVQGVISAAFARQDDLIVAIGDVVHKNCREKYVHKKTIDRLILQKERHPDHAAGSDGISLKRKLRSENETAPFHTKTHCLFCGMQQGIDRETNDPNVSKVRTIEFTHTIENVCTKRGDNWGTEVKCRISASPDCFAADAIYHRNCCQRFMSYKNPPTYARDESLYKHVKRGRPVGSVNYRVFLQVANYLQENEELSLTVKDLVVKMNEFLCARKEDDLNEQEYEQEYNEEQKQGNEQQHEPEHEQQQEPEYEQQQEPYNEQQHDKEHAFGPEHEQEQEVDHDGGVGTSIGTRQERVARRERRMENLREDATATEQETNAYDIKTMKKKLISHFGENIVIASVQGKSDVVLLRRTATQILHQFHSTRRDENNEDEKARIIRTAAELILTDIKNVSSRKTMIYPSILELESMNFNLNFIPDALRLFLNSLLPSASCIKIASLGQAVMQAARPRSLISPLQIGLSAQMHHHFASRYLIDTLHHMGFCSSYQETGRFKINSAIPTNANQPYPTNGDSFIQFVADNVDHNVETLDGTGTFHGMGIISVTTPAVVHDTRVPRNSPTLNELLGTYSIAIHPYTDSITMGEKSFQVPETDIDLHKHDKSDIVDFVWKLCRQYGDIPSYSAFMQAIMKEPHPGRSTIEFLPMIDLNSSDPTCIFSTLLFIQEQAKAANTRSICTLDQPLHWKARCILMSEEGVGLKSTILRLGGFHVMMSFLGSIGHLMAGSGLQETMETIYAPNSVLHILSGKAFSRAIRAHSLVQVALFSNLLNELRETFPQNLEERAQLPGPSNVEQSSSSLEELEDICKKYVAKVLAGGPLEEIVGNEDILKLQYIITDMLKDRSACRTTQLWLMYNEMLDILFKFLKAERTGNFKLHIACLKAMLPFLAASGHNNYTKSIVVYLEDMDRLEREDQVTFDALSKHHAVRRSDRFWGGLSLDYIIESVLMKSIKSTGGLTRKRGFTDTQRMLWCKSMPVLAAVNRSMQSITGTSYESSEQHKEAGPSRVARDVDDIKTLQTVFEERMPFTRSAPLRNLFTGQLADAAVNVERSKQIGISILKNMNGKVIDRFSFKKDSASKTLASKTAVKIDGDVIVIDQQLMFQRLLFVANRETNRKIDREVDREAEREALFIYEMCSYPPSLFTSQGILLEADKPSLMTYLWDTYITERPTSMPLHDMQVVLDGGALLHKISWPKSATYRSIFDMYVHYVLRKYKNAIVVFDGYSGEPSTKDIAHARRGSSMTGPEVVLDESNKVCLKKDLFLSNYKNKQQFLYLLGVHLSNAGCTVHHSTGDADCLIVQKSIESAQTKPTVLVADDTDLLCLLLHHAHGSLKQLIFAPAPKSTSKKPPRIWDIQHARSQIGADLCKDILFLHALSGCDTTSRLYGIGKGKFVTKYLSDDAFKNAAATFYDSAASNEHILLAGENTVKLMYDAANVTTTTLNKLRCQKFHLKVATSSTYVQSKSLPPTTAACNEHSLRVYLQVQEWKNHPCCLNPEEYGWKLQDNKYVPVFFRGIKPAPDQLLRIIRCTCKGDCSKANCSCRFNGLECTSACKECRGSTCLNSKHTEEIDDNEPGEDTGIEDPAL